MWENIKKDPLVKTIVVIFLGILAFGFAFNLMFGSGGSHSEEGQMDMSSGLTLNNSIETMIAFLIKIAVIALLVGIIVWVIRAITKNTPGSQAGKLEWVKNDPFVRNAFIIIGAVIALVLLFSVLRGVFFPGYGYGEGEMMGGGSYGLFSNSSYLLQSVLILLLKLLILISFAGLGFALFKYLKENSNIFKISSMNEKEENKTDFVCPDCRAELKKSWKCCPNCGSDKAFSDENSRE